MINLRHRGNPMRQRYQRMHRALPRRCAHIFRRFMFFPLCLLSRPSAPHWLHLKPT